MKDNNCWRANFITCPYCGHVHEDTCDYPWGQDRNDTVWNDGDEKDFDCDSCNKEFRVELHIDYAFSSSRKEEAKDEEQAGEPEPGE